jgi:hypothetical protein
MGQLRSILATGNCSRKIAAQNTFYVERQHSPGNESMPVIARCAGAIGSDRLGVAGYLCVPPAAPTLIATLADQSMLVAQRINDLVTAHQRPICDKCIVTALNMTALAHSAQITATLGTTSDFSRDHGTCSVCRRIKMVIQSRKPQPGAAVTGAAI